MITKIFDGKEYAARREAILTDEVKRLHNKVRMGSIVFNEDPGSKLYTKLKMQAAVRCGIEFSEQEAFLREPVQMIQEKIKLYCDREDLAGVLVQKPAKEVWLEAHKCKDGTLFDTWWQQLVMCIDEFKDVDCLTPENLGKVFTGKWEFLPATVKAVLLILREALGDEGVTGRNIAVIGRSDLVGRPLAAVLESYGAYVAMFGASNMDKEMVHRADIVISATGSEKIVTEDLVKNGDIVIDVGAPKGDVDFEAVKSKAAFITPVPGGVGPVTVVSLLENLVKMAMEREGKNTI
jgi:methylenetetrahydrofolate dehydrogenase (NADP+)/methenyltetrahydrofolate cyclohydrolase